LHRPPRLFGIVVGIDAYYDGDLGLAYAANDARTIKRTLQDRGSRLFAAIDIRTLIDEDATKQRITEVFRELAGVVQPSDVFVLYLSGHGFAEQGRYHFIPQELRYSNLETLRETSLQEHELVGLLAEIEAQKSLVILDTCYAGAFDEARQFAFARGIEEKAAIDRLMRATGRAVLAASTSRALALEGYNGHGLYTYALLEGLRGDADRRAGNGNGAVSVLELGAFLDERVPALSLEAFSQRQVPMHQLSGQNFLVTLVD
jgi:uncharacterized caspase-like protein